MNESELVRRCKAGDRSAQKELYARTAHRVYGLLLKLTRHEHDALDLAQETYIRAFQQIQQFEEQAAFATWLYRIACNEALQFLRAKTRRSKNTEHFGRQKHFEPVNHSSDTAGAEYGGNDEVRADIRSALSRLTPDEQTILVLRYHEGLDYRKLAEVLECAPGTVASRLNRARMRLKEVWESRHRVREEK